MRMWMIPPKLMCTQHLLGEHVELHMFVGTINKGRSIQGYIAKGLVMPGKIEKRHAQIVKEMERRGMNHKSPLPEIIHINVQPGHVDVKLSLTELKRRCLKCKSKMEGGEK